MLYVCVVFQERRTFFGKQKWAFRLGFDLCFCFSEGESGREGVRAGVREPRLLSVSSPPASVTRTLL